MGMQFHHRVPETVASVVLPCYQPFMTRLRFLIVSVLAGLASLFGIRVRQGQFTARLVVCSKPVNSEIGYVVTHRIVERDEFPATLVRGGFIWNRGDVVTDPEGQRCAFYSNEAFPCAAVWPDGTFWVYSYPRNEWNELA